MKNLTWDLQHEIESEFDSVVMLMQTALLSVINRTKSNYRACLSCRLYPFKLINGQFTNYLIINSHHKGNPLLGQFLHFQSTVLCLQNLQACLPY